ncbi:ankryin [Brevibacillus borstelensis cifa_chp40]|nr:ankryin [Brevibacillus borstelensis cifa_chp40]
MRCDVNKRYLIFALLTVLVGIGLFQLSAVFHHGQTKNYNDNYDETFNPNEFIRAAQNGNVDEVKPFIQNNMNPDVTDNDGRTVLLHAVIGKKHEVAEYLLMNKADPNIKDFYGDLPLKISREINDAKLTELLERNGAKE